MSLYRRAGRLALRACSRTPYKKSVTFERNFVTGRFERARAAPAPNEDHVFLAGIVEAVPVAARGENHVALAGRLAAGVGVDKAAAFHDDEEFVGVGMAMLVMARAWR